MISGFTGLAAPRNLEKAFRRLRLHRATQEKGREFLRHDCFVNYVKMHIPSSIIFCGLWVAVGLTITNNVHAGDAKPAGPSLETGGVTATLTVDLEKAGPAVSPVFFGAMTEEVNHAYEGGLYAELIQNRAFKDDAKTPVHWSLVKEQGSVGSIVLDTGQRLNEALPVSLKLKVTQPGKRLGVANDGFWGIPVKPGTNYRASFYAKAGKEGAGPLTVDIESEDGATIYAEAQTPNIGSGWQQYCVSLTTGGDVKPTEKARFVISTSRPGTVWLDLVSLFPPTWNGRPNGNRADIMQLLATLKPRFLRFPGGNYLEGDWFRGRFDWKKTIGPLEQRPGHQGCWGYRSSDGMGLLEFLEWCEDLKMQPVLAVFAGFTLKNDYIEAGPLLQGFVNEALDEIEYVTGDVNTKWGAERAKDGHPEPFPLRYVEIGNEDFFDTSGSYEGRFAQFYDAIRAKYPKLRLIATTKVASRVPDLSDEHYYRSAGDMEREATQFDHYSRSGPKIFVGEWATRNIPGMKKNGPTPDMGEALGDAAWMTGMERNADVIEMQSYAPLFTNVNEGARQWDPNMIGYDALGCYGSPSYYAQMMFSTHLGDVVAPIAAQNVPLQAANKPGSFAPGMPSLFFVATRDGGTGTIYLKVVNVVGVPAEVRIDLHGTRQVAPEGQLVVLTAGKPEDTNTIAEPAKVTPVSSRVSGLSNSFTRTFAPYSVNVLQLETR
jgi:alpha-N-arabinofuranosidase